jgi:hypothetical protein
MRPYSDAVKADVRRRMGPPHRQSVAEISQELGIHVITLYKWRKAWRLQGGGGAGFLEGSPGVEPDRQVHGGAGDRWPERDGIGWVLPRAWPVPRTGGPLAPGRPECQRPAAADDGRSERPPEAAPRGSAGRFAEYSLPNDQIDCIGVDNIFIKCFTAFGLYCVLIRSIISMLLSLTRRQDLRPVIHVMRDLVFKNNLISIL